MIGDFNKVRNCIKISGGNFNLSEDNLVSQMFDACGVVDLDTIGGIFSWRKSSQYGGDIHEKLDRCLVDVATFSSIE